MKDLADAGIGCFCLLYEGEILLKQSRVKQLDKRVVNKILDRIDFLPPSENLLPLVVNDKSIGNAGFDTQSATSIIKDLIRAGANVFNKTDGETAIETICRKAAKPAPLLGAFGAMKTESYLFHDLCKNKKIKQKDQLKNGIDHISRILGSGARVSISSLTDNGESILHLVASSAVCSRESILQLKGLINDNDIVNVINHQGKTAYQIVSDNKAIDSTTRDKCLRLLKPSEVRNKKLNDMENKLKSLVELRESILESRNDKEKSILDDYEYDMPRRRRFARHLKFEVDWIETQEHTVCSTNLVFSVSNAVVFDNIKVRSEIRQSVQQRNKLHVDFGFSIEKAPHGIVVSSPVCHLISSYRMSVIEPITDYVIKSTPCGPYHVQVPIDAFDARWLKKFQTELIPASEQNTSKVENVQPCSEQVSYKISSVCPYLTEKSKNSRLIATNGISQKVVQVSFNSKPKSKPINVQKKEKALVSLKSFFTI